MKVQHTNAWTNSWKSYQQQVSESSIAQTAALDKKRLKIHSLLKKAESALATQIRTGRLFTQTPCPRHHLPGLPLRLA